MSRRKWRWVTRNDGYGDNVIYIWNLYRPKPEKVRGEWNMDDAADEALICADEFKKLTGITVPTDRPIKVEFSAKVVE